MENTVSSAGETMMWGVLIVMTLTLWVLLHKCVSRYYFGGFSNMIMTIIMELFGCFVVSVMLLIFLHEAVGHVIGFLVTAIGTAIGAIAKILFLLLKIGLVAILIGVMTLIIIKIMSGQKYNNNEVYEENRVDLENMMSYEPENNSDLSTEATDEQSTALVEIAPDEMYCTSCGQVIKRNAKFCRYCGELNEYGMQKLQKEQENSK